MATIFGIILIGLFYLLYLIISLIAKLIPSDIKTGKTNLEFVPHMSNDLYRRHLIVNREDYILDLIHATDDDKKCVVIIGIGGRIGSNIALKLPKYGVKNLIGIDNDIVTLSNIAKPKETPYTAQDVGRAKVDVLSEILRYKYKGINVRVHKTYVTDRMSMDELNYLCKDAVIVIFAIDTKDLMILEKPSLLMNRIYILSQMHGRDGGGKIIYYIPFLNPCFVHSQGFSFNEIIEGKAIESNITTDDIKIVSNETCKMTASFLFRRHNTLLNKLNFNRGNYLDIEKLEEGRYRKVWIRTKKSNGCIMCGNTLFPLT